jgi:hypothetical protein
MKYEPSPVMKKPVIWSSWSFVNVVFTVVRGERPPQLNMPRPERMENTVPDS